MLFPWEHLACGTLVWHGSGTRRAREERALLSDWLCALFTAYFYLTFTFAFFLHF